MVVEDLKSSFLIVTTTFNPYSSMLSRTSRVSGAEIRLGQTLNNALFLKLKELEVILNVKE